MADDELRELIKDAPKFEHMDRGELVAHAYGLFAAGNKAGAENAKLRELCVDMHKSIGSMRTSFSEFIAFGERMSDLGIEV